MPPGLLRVVLKISWAPFLVLTIVSCGAPPPATTSGPGSPSPGEYLWQVSNTIFALYTSTVNSNTGQIGAAEASGGYACNAITNVSTIAVAPSKKFLFVADQCVSRVHVYLMSGPGVKLAEISGSPFDDARVGGSPVSLAVDRSGEFLYEVSEPQEIVQWDIDSTTGALTYASAVMEPTTASLVQGVADPTGNFLYAADGYGRVFAYVIGNAGTLSPVMGSPFTVPVNGQPSHIVVDSGGKFLYMPLYGGGVAGFTIDNLTGALASIPQSSFPTTSLPNNLTVDPSGKFLYVTVSDANGSVYGFNIDTSSGALTEITGSPFSIGGAFCLAVDASGLFLYGSNPQNGTIKGFRIDPSTGSLSELAGSPFPAAPVPLNIVSLTIP